MSDWEPDLHDTDPMPFGKYQGVRMQDVPASYFHYLWVKEKKDAPRRTDPVARYIERNLHALRLEHPDGIWE